MQEAKDRGMAVLINLARRVRRYRRLLRKYRREGLDEGALTQLRTQENEAWNILQGAKTVYYTGKPG